MPSLNSTIARNIFKIEPLADPRWTGLLAANSASSVFHSPQWLEALRRTYSYTPIAFTTCSPTERLTNALLFCRVDSWLTGSRLVSVPFSDHCAPLLDDSSVCNDLCRAAEFEMRSQKLRYVEIRPLQRNEYKSDLYRSPQFYWLHLLDLQPDLETLFRNCHKDSTQRKIRRAEKEGLRYVEGQSDEILRDFFRLMIETRRRHNLPPQPRAWFQNLRDCFGEALKIRIAYLGKRPTASILTIRFNATIVYKYGCSAVAFNNLGGTQYLFWKTIQEAKAANLLQFDLGRSNIDQAGLIKFKDRWGASRQQLEYIRFTPSSSSIDNYTSSKSEWREKATNRVVGWLPGFVLCRIGNILYKHVG